MTNRISNSLMSTDTWPEHEAEMTNNRKLNSVVKQARAQAFNKCWQIGKFPRVAKPDGSAMNSVFHDVGLGLFEADRMQPPIQVSSLVMFRGGLKATAPAGLSPTRPGPHPWLEQAQQKLSSNLLNMDQLGTLGKACIRRSSQGINARTAHIAAGLQFP
ncbi:hypothetical protein B0H11DRAFT_1935581 [Mycena galericulata]|nr:hypothetical protein B0H11DRAFT_1935581 [Mycena galericulata]